MDRTEPIVAEDIAADSTVGYPEPFRTRMGKANWRALGDHFGLTQFGVSFETLEPNAQSSVRHWHTLADEFLYVIEGELSLRTNDGEFLLQPGACMGFKAGDKNAHHLINRSAALAKFIVVGSRVPGDMAFYPDDDLAVFVTEHGRRAVHKDGTPYPSPPSET
ncbi:cupin domain-containing protein [Aquabacterium sp.]|uniref:cupin domain-containing protein n=1 Tax=Aquabacterium sp. TaxID=1872578 RepID=UPI002B9B0864|nr:cupin domain-containing protein [Aquabacterium sp.]HSW06485.1 cupin domain-containing protein [Aquabacterium sp.]